MIRPSEFEIRSQQDEAGVRLEVEGELDLATAPRLVEEAEQRLSVAPARLVIDLRKLTFADSSGLRALISIHHSAATAQCPLSLIAPPDEVVTVFRISGAAQNLPFRET